MPPFEFLKVTREVPASRIFVRDLNQAWYFKGLTPEINSIEKTAAFLREKIESLKPRITVFTGNSAGGYAAILFGLLLDPDHVLAFSPQTFIDRRNRLLHWDRRWKKEVREVYKYSLPQERFYDLKKVAREFSGNCRFSLYYSPRGRVDAAHCNRMRTLQNFSIYFDARAEEHGIVKYLRDTGKLREIFLAIFREGRLTGR